MKRFTTNSEIEILCEAMIKDFFKSKRYAKMLCVDIEAFVTEYLGIPIVYETFAESDPGRIGFLSDGKRPLWVARDNIKQQVVFPSDTVVLDKFLLSVKESARKRFTIAHEGAHVMLKRHVPMQSSPASAFHSEFDCEMAYSPDMFKEMMSVNECFANRAAACFLMPGFLVESVLERYNHSQPVILYEGNILAQEQKLIIQRMADALGVSYTAFFHRLNELALFDMRPIEEYLHNSLLCGGGV